MPLLLFCTASAWAVDPNRHISQYSHEAWREQDGFFGSEVSGIAQTQDGYVWIGTVGGLERFDGVRFTPWNPEPGARLSSIRGLLAASDGSLWISTAYGLSRWKDHTLTNYPGGPLTYGPVHEDSRGRIWFTKGLSGEATPVCEVVGAETRCYATGEPMPDFTINAAVEGRENSFWLAGDTMLLHWNPTSHSVYRFPGPATRAKGIRALARTPDGTLWVGVAGAGPGLGLQRFDDGRWSSFKTEGLDGSTLDVHTLYADREGALWIGTFGQGIYRIRGKDVDHFGTADGLSSDTISRFFEDREANLWVATTLGVDRFADTTVVNFTSREGLCSPEAASILASRDGTIWSGGDGALTNVRNSTVSCLRTGKGLPGSQVTSLLEDHAGRLWAGVDEDLWVRENGVFLRIKKTDGKGVGFVTGITEDSEHSIWVTVNKPRRIMMRIEGLTVREEYQEPREPRKLAADPTGGIWIGLLKGDLAHFYNGHVKTYRFAHGDGALVNQLLANPDGSVLAATSYGLIGWRNGRLLQLTARNGLPCAAVHALAFDNEGNLWLYMDCGLGKVTSVDLRRWLQDPDSIVSIKTLDAFDGVSGGLASFNGAATSADGRLWFANGRYLQLIDPTYMHRNSVPPPVHIEQVIADRKSYPATGVVHLPPLTRDLEIDYVGLSFVAPQKVLFRYRLEGRDSSWQEPGTRRQAVYNNLGPRSYRLRVIACNNDGLWNEEGAVLDFVIAPAIYQTLWFGSSGAIAFVALLWGLHRYRLHQLAREFSLRLEERVGERTRIARDLHDTLLQSFQGLMLRLQVVDDLLPEGKAKDQLDQTLQRADQAIAEGRSAVYDLRSSAASTNDLAQAVKALGDELATRDSAAFRLVEEGTTRDLHPIIRDEVYRVTREAIRNAFSHAHANHVEAEIAWGQRAFRLRIRDDGAGIAPEILEEGRPGHYGLRGMRERATQIGGKLEIWSRTGAGTEIQLSIAASIAYRTLQVRSLFRPFPRKAG